MGEERKAEEAVLYQLRITRQRPNPEYRQYRPDGHWAPPTTPFIEMESLSITVTAEQFEAIRKAVLEKF